MKKFLQTHQEQIVELKLPNRQIVDVKNVELIGLSFKILVTFMSLGAY
jgi:hypothetical protein